MDWVEYVARLQSWIEGMQRSEDYSVDFELRPGMTPEEIDDIEGYLRAEPDLEDVRISADLRAFYQETSGFSLQWYYEGVQETRRRPRHGGGTVYHGQTGGYVDIVLLSEIYTPVERHQAGERDIPFVSLYGDYRTFDHLGGDRVCMRFSREHQEPALFYYDSDAKSYHPLALDITAYMEMLFAARALQGWQRFFVADPDYEIDPGWEEWFREDLQQVFPDADVARFQR